MSTAAHEPRRVGPHRADSPSGSKVTPRRNAAESHEPIGLQYDSDELPVLIRLPNLRDVSSVEQRPKTSAQERRQGSLRDTKRSSLSTQRTSKQSRSQSTKKSIQQHAGDNKMILGGIIGGVLIVVMLFLFNSNGSAPPTDQDGWASEAAALEADVQEPAFPQMAELEPPPPFPSFTYEAPKTEAPQLASGELYEDTLNAPISNVTGPRQSETAALPAKQRAVAGWPSDDAMGSQTVPGKTPVNLWPGESVSLEQGGYEYAPTDSPSQVDYRSSMYPAETESYRMGKLGSDRQQPTPSERSSILNGNIEIPDTTSIR